ncbi:adenine nucleotide translocase lysine N-methyltransferase isoform X1 [Pogona vitticeps]
MQIPLDMHAIISYAGMLIFTSMQDEAIPFIGVLKIKEMKSFCGGNSTSSGLAQPLSRIVQKTLCKIWWYIFMRVDVSLLRLIFRFYGLINLSKFMISVVAEHRPTRKPHRSTDTRRGDSFGLSFQVLEAYRRGFRPVVGYELNPLLLQLSSFHAWRAGCYGKVSYRQEDFWKANLSDCNNVTVFLAPSVVPPLERKLLSELPEEACVVAARFPFVKWTPASVAGDGLEQAWAYNIRDVRRAEQATAGGRPREESNPVPEEEAVQEKGWREEH